MQSQMLRSISVSLTASAGTEVESKAAQTTGYVFDSTTYKRRQLAQHQRLRFNMNSQLKLYVLLAGLVCNYSIGLYMTAEVLDRSRLLEIREMIDRHGAESSVFPSEVLMRFVERTE